MKNINKIITTVFLFIVVTTISAADLKELAEQLVNITHQPKSEIQKHLELLTKQGVKDEKVLKNLTISYFATEKANKKGKTQNDFKKELGSKLGYFLKQG